MCGILGFKTKGDNSRIRLRGRDFYNEVKVNNFTFVHNLLQVTGEFLKQPFIDGDTVALYNGEIYNHKFTKSDGENIIPLYREHGIDFPKYLDGEFAIVLFDFKNDIALFVTDPFKTKPLFINGIEFGSYHSGVGGEKANPNEIIVKRITTSEVIAKKKIIEWDLTQYKNNYDDWIAAFKNAIKKRARNKCFLGLSSGYDSGAIICEMLKLGIEFKAYSFYNGIENYDILNKRLSLLTEKEIFEPDKNLLPFLRKNVDNEKLTFIVNGKETHKGVLEEGGTLGVATFCSLANKEGRKICISSQGADEILSDYALWPEQSELKGIFPKELKLWKNFNYSCQECYLTKEEYGGGAFNVETRYPFLDRKLVQEFLWLKHELKNLHYKAPLREYLVRENFPFDEGKKFGFNVTDKYV